MHTCRGRMITPYKVNQPRITDNDDGIDFGAICEPSSNDGMVAGKRPEYGETRKTLSVFSCNKTCGFPQSCPERCDWLQSHFHERLSNFFLAFSLPPLQQ